MLGREQPKLLASNVLREALGERGSPALSGMQQASQAIQVVAWSKRNGRKASSA